LLEDGETDGIVSVTGNRRRVRDLNMLNVAFGQ
jgi:hypothetical protein